MSLTLKLMSVTLTLFLTVAFAGPVLLAEEANLDTTYHQLSARIQDKIRLTSEQRLELLKLMETRKEGERHLRRQMLTTYTPQQRQHAAVLWEQRDKTRFLSQAERRELRARVGVSAEQERQFEAYEEKLRAHREQTVYLTGQLLGPEQRQMAKDLEFVL